MGRSHGDVSGFPSSLPRMPPQRSASGWRRDGRISARPPLVGPLRPSWQSSGFPSGSLGRGAASKPPSTCAIKVFRGQCHYRAPPRKHDLGQGDLVTPGPVPWTGAFRKAEAQEEPPKGSPTQPQGLAAEAAPFRGGSLGLLTQMPRDGHAEAPRGQGPAWLVLEPRAKPRLCPGRPGPRGFTSPTGWSSAFLTYQGWTQVRGASGWTARGFRVEKVLGKCQESGALRDDGDNADRSDKDDGLLATLPLFHSHWTEHSPQRHPSPWALEVVRSATTHALRITAWRLV